MKKLLMLIIILIIGQIASGQSTFCTKDPPGHTSGSGGFLLYKCVTLLPLSTWVTGASSNAVETGQTFQYTIWFTIPDIANDVVIVDNVPPVLEILNTVPASSITGNTATYHVPPSTPRNSSQNFTINVRFPAGTTCNGTIASNKATMTATELAAPLEAPPIDVTAPTIDVVAYAVNPFDIAKYPLLPYDNSTGYYQGVYDGNVTYELVVGKPTPYYYQTIGQQNLRITKIVDIVPSGAQLVSCSSNCTASLSGTAVTIIPIPPGPVLHGEHFTPMFQCEITIHYPAAYFAQNSIIRDSAYYEGTSCGNVVSVPTASAVKIKLDGASSGAPKPYKTHYVTNPVPGCSGVYELIVKNEGNFSLGPYTIIDQIPPEILVDGITIYTDCFVPLPITISIDNNAITSLPPNPPNNTAWTNPNPTTPVQTVQIIQGNTTNQLPPYKYYKYRIYFTIDPSLTGYPDVINTATFTCSPFDTTVTDKFPIEQRQPKVCLYKTVCDQKTSYMYGDRLRYRLRIQNNGSGILSGATIQDVLDDNLQYIGNEKYYFSTSDYDGSNCVTGAIPASATLWTGSGLNPSKHSGQTLTWNLPDIPAYCASVSLQNADGCDPNGITYYYIEFTVEVGNKAPAGSLLNEFKMTGGGLQQSPIKSNTAYITINNYFGAIAEKFVSVDNGVTWVKNAVASQNSFLYRLQVTNTSNYNIKDIVFLDLLPIDINSSLLTPDDRKILDRLVPNNRGSQFNVTYSTTDVPGWDARTTLPAASLTFIAPIVSIINADDICTPELPVNTPTCTNYTWTSGTGKNVKFEFGPNNVLPPTGILTCDFKVNIPATTPANLKVCNDFAVKSNGSFMVGSAPVTIENIPTASDIACVTFVPANGPCNLVLTSTHGILCPGDPVLITWSGSSPTGTVNLSLIDVTNWVVYQSIVTNYPNTGSYPWTIPTNIPCDPMREWQFYIQDPNTTCWNYGPPFFVKCCPGFDTCCDSFDIHIQSSVVKMGLNWYVQSNLTAGPDSLYEIRADMVNFYMNEQEGCERCETQNIFFGSMIPTNNPRPYQTSQINWAPPSGPWIIPALPPSNGSFMDYSPREFVWNQKNNGQYVLRPPLNNEDVYFRIIFPKVFPNQCCKDTINFCIRWSFSDKTCRTCDTLICYTVYPEPWQGIGMFPSPESKKQTLNKQESIKMKDKKQKGEVSKEVPRYEQLPGSIPDTLIMYRKDK